MGRLYSVFMQYFIKTFGCQMNVSDSERMAGFLEAQKIQPAKDITKANIVIFNTCGVRKMAEDRAYGQIHNLWKNNPQTKIVLTGCLANRKDIQEKLKNKVALFCEIKDFMQELENFLLCHSERSPYSDEVEESTNNHRQLHHKADSSTPLCSAQNDNCYLTVTPKYANSAQAYVPIMTGCNNFCSYCVVPYARGREVSRPAEEILQEIKKLIKSGVKEITLLGQNVNSYEPLPSPQPSPEYGRGGKMFPSLLYSGEMSRTRDREGDVVNFSDLLKTINAIPGDFWIRFMTPHPKDMTAELIETITSLEKVCEAVHLPIQSGDDTILKNMNRHYTRAHYLQLIEKIKNSFAKNKPEKIFALSSDIIVGFPGETKVQLEKTAGVMRRVQYDMSYFGQFSPRPGTAAFKLKDNIKKEEKVRREKYLNEILAASALKNNQQYLGKTFDVLVDNGRAGKYFGHTRTLKNVKIKTSQKKLAGKLLEVRITRVNTWNLEGRLA